MIHMGRIILRTIVARVQPRVIHRLPFKQFILHHPKVFKRVIGLAQSPSDIQLCQNQIIGTKKVCKYLTCLKPRKSVQKFNDLFRIKISDGSSKTFSIFWRFFSKIQQFFEVASVQFWDNKLFQRASPLSFGDNTPGSAS